MDIAVVSDLTCGGAGTACRRLCRGLEERKDLRVEWITAKTDPFTRSHSCDRWPPMLETVALRLAVRFGLGARTFARLSNRLNAKGFLTAIAARRPSLINLHNIHEAVSFEFVEKLPPRIPIVWTLHDMWPLTGYCCHSFDCTKYLEGCLGECPRRGKWGPTITRQDTEWRRRQSFYEHNQNRLTIVCPSEWLAKCARKRFGGRIRVEVIPNGLDMQVFRPIRNGQVLRNILGLSTEGAVVLAGSQYVDDELKGTQLLMKAMEKLASEERHKITVVVFGRKDAAFALPRGWRNAGVVHDEILLSLYYNAADVFVLPSLADNLPNTLVEATATGTPCVTFDVGGCPEAVRDGETGFVAKYRDVDDLAACIERVLTMPETEKARMRANCRQVAEKEYALGIQAERYMKLFEELCGKRTQGGPIRQENLAGHA